MSPVLDDEVHHVAEVVDRATVSVGAVVEHAAAGKPGAPGSGWNGVIEQQPRPAPRDRRGDQHILKAANHPGAALGHVVLCARTCPVRASLLGGSAGGAWRSGSAVGLSTPTIDPGLAWGRWPSAITHPRGSRTRA